jgi:hypothetical protein
VIVDLLIVELLLVGSALVEAAPARLAPAGPAAVVGEPAVEQPARLEWKARILARAAYEETTVSSAGVETASERLRLTTPSARAGLKYQFLPWLSLVAEAELTDRQPIRDAFVQARTKRIRARAGQFKMPLSAITLESPWVLPVARRGLIQELLEDRLSVVGRRPGFLSSVKRGGSLDPELSLSAFQGAFLTGDADDTDVEPLETGVDAQNLVARFSVTPGGQELALFTARVSTSGFQGQRRHFWASGADATLDEPLGLTGLRAWLESIVGRTFYIVDGR